jgi:glycosyltransferase involved in cell wall biosynthesis
MLDKTVSISAPYAEQSFSNGILTQARLTICVPTYCDDARPLIARLSALSSAKDCALIVFDDGSGNPSLNDAHGKAVQSFPGPAQFFSASENRGRSAARNRLIALSQTDWILFLDADMLPDHADFLDRYLTGITGSTTPALIAGGFSVSQIMPGTAQRLHYVQAARSDCADAATRARDPGRFVFSSNILAHRSILEAIKFDETFSGWGWEDVDWGLRVAARHPIFHIENTATHLGLEDDSVLVKKFGTSGQNFGHLVRKHPQAAEKMPLLRAARAIKPFAFAAPLAKSVALQKSVPDSVRVTALKLYRAAMYSRYI